MWYFSHGGDFVLVKTSVTGCNLSIKWNGGNNNGVCFKLVNRTFSRLERLYLIMVVLFHHLVHHFLHNLEHIHIHTPALWCSLFHMVMTLVWNRRFGQEFMVNYIPELSRSCLYFYTTDTLSIPMVMEDFCGFQTFCAPFFLQRYQLHGIWVYLSPFLLFLCLNV